MFTVIYNTFLLSNNRFNTRRRPSFNASQNSYNKCAIWKTTQRKFSVFLQTEVLQIQCSLLSYIYRT